MKPKKANHSTSSTHNPEIPRVAGSLKKEQNQQANKDKDLRNIICYNCDKKHHYTSKYPKAITNRSKS